MSDSIESMLDLPPADNAWKSKVLTRKVFDKIASAEKFRKANKLRNHLKMQDNFGSSSDKARNKDHTVNLTATRTGLGGGGGNNSCNHGMLD